MIRHLQTGYARRDEMLKRRKRKGSLVGRLAKVFVVFLKNNVERFMV